MEAPGTSSVKAAPLLQLLMRTGIDVAEVWPVARDILARAPIVGPDMMTLDQAYLELLATKMQLWMLNDEERFLGAMLTDLWLPENSQEKLLRLRWLAGEKMAEFLPLLEAVERWGVSQGATWASALEARVGFERVLRPLGYSSKVITLYKKLGKPTEH